MIAQIEEIAVVQTQIRIRCGGTDLKIKIVFENHSPKTAQFALDAVINLKRSTVLRIFDNT